MGTSRLRPFSSRLTPTSCRRAWAARWGCWERWPLPSKPRARVRWSRDDRASARPMLSLDCIACLQPHALVGFQPQRPLCCEHLAGDLVGEVIARPVRPQMVGVHLLRMIGEIRHDEESLAAAVPDIAEEMPVAGLDELSVAIVYRRLLLPQSDQPHQLREDAAVRRAGVILYPLLPGPISLRTVDPTTVAGLVEVIGERVVVQWAELVAQVDQRDTADAQDNAVQHQDAPHSQLNLLLVGVVLDRLLQPRKRGQRARDAGVAGGRVLLEGYAACKRAGEAPNVELVQERPVAGRIDPLPAGVVVVKSPADIVVRAQVVHPGRTLRQPETVAHRVIEQLDLAGRQRLPQQRHQQRVVAYLALPRADVAQHVVGMDDSLGLE